MILTGRWPSGGNTSRARFRTHAPSPSAQRAIARGRTTKPSFAQSRITSPRSSARFAMRAISTCCVGSRESRRGPTSEDSGGWSARIGPRSRRMAVPGVPRGTARTRGRGAQRRQRRRPLHRLPHPSRRRLPRHQRRRPPRPHGPRRPCRGGLLRRRPPRPRLPPHGRRPLRRHPHPRPLTGRRSARIRPLGAGQGLPRLLGPWQRIRLPQRAPLPIRNATDQNIRSV